MNSMDAVAALAALAQESRLAIYRLLVEAGPTGLSVSEIGASTRIPPATLSFHLKELTHAGLAIARPEGRFIFYSAKYDAMRGLLGYLTENCCARDGAGCGVACDPGSCKPSARRARGRTTRSRT